MPLSALRTLTILLLLLLLAPLAGCAKEKTVFRAEREAQEAWEHLQESANRVSFETFIAKNRLAARHHASDALGGSIHDQKGVQFQVRAIEAQSLAAVRDDDVQLATSAAERVEELTSTGMLELYEERFPGAGDRLVAARERVLPLLTQR